MEATFARGWDQQSACSRIRYQATPQVRAEPCWAAQPCSTWQACTALVLFACTVYQARCRPPVFSQEPPHTPWEGLQKGSNRCWPCRLPRPHPVCLPPMPAAGCVHDVHRLRDHLAGKCHSRVITGGCTAVGMLLRSRRWAASTSLPPHRHPLAAHPRHPLLTPSLASFCPTPQMLLPMGLWEERGGQWYTLLIVFFVALLLLSVDSVATQVRVRVYLWVWFGSTCPFVVPGRGCGPHAPLAA